MSGVRESELPSVIVRMVETLTPVGRSELARRLQIELAPKHDLPAERVAELGPLARILRGHGHFTARLSDHFDLPALQAEADELAARRVQARGGTWSPDPSHEYRAHSPRRDEPTEQLVAVQFPGRRPRGHIRAPLPIDEWRTIEPARYDELRSSAAPSASRLSSSYGSWLVACRAADGPLHGHRPAVGHEKVRSQVGRVPSRGSPPGDPRVRPSHAESA
jgi:hypothetical protein